MRINRNMLLKIARDSVDNAVAADRTLMAVYLQGSLLGESPLLGNTADIDLFFIHSDDVAVDREIVRVSDEVTLDISHHAHKVYRQPRELRVHAWLGPAIYDCKIMYDPQHFLDFVQASVRGQFSSPENTLLRVRKQVEHARQMWEAFDGMSEPSGPEDILLYLRALDHAANSIAGLSRQTLTERRFLLELPARVEAVRKPGMYQGFLGLLGAPSVDAPTVRSWLPDWRSAYTSLPASSGPIRLHPFRRAYYESAIESILSGPTPLDALWPLWHTWTVAVCASTTGDNILAAWQKAGEQLGLLGTPFSEKVQGLDAYLDTVEEVLETWARENGG